MFFQAFMAIVGWFRSISQLLFDNMKLSFGNSSVSYGALCVGFIVIGMFISYFWKGAKG